METLPPPPSPDADVPSAAPERPRHVPRAGELTTGWCIIMALGWIGIVAVLAAAWNVSRQLGLSTWWLGPAHDQRPPYVLVLPFVAPAIILILVGNRVRYIPWIGLLGAAATAAVGLGDLGRVQNLGLVELLAAAAGLLVSVASFSGMYRSGGASVTDEVSDDAAGSVGTPVYRAGEPAPG